MFIQDYIQTYVYTGFCFIQDYIQTYVYKGLYLDLCL